MTNDFPKNMEQLKPCPFCGSHNVIIRTRTKDAWVQCEDCKSKGAFISFTQEDIKTILQTEAVKAWNMREVNADKGVLEKINEKQDSLRATCNAWDEAIKKDGYVN